MDYMAALKEINSGRLRPVYLVCAEEPLLAEELLGALEARVVPPSATSAYVLFKYDAETQDPDAVVAELRAGTFFGSQKLGIIKNLPKPRASVRPDQPQREDSDAEKEILPGASARSDQAQCEDEGSDVKKNTLQTRSFAKRWENALVSYAQNPNPDAVCAIVVSYELPARHPLKRACEETGAVIKCARLRGRQIGQWAKEYIERRGKSVSSRAVWALQTISGASLGVLREELEKLLAYIGERPAVDLEDILAVCIDTSEIRVFAATDAVTEGKTSDALAAISKLLESGEPAPRVLAAITTNFRTVARAQRLRASGLSVRDAQKALGGHPYAASKAVKTSSKLDAAAVELLYECLVDADMALKSGVDPVLSLQTLIARIAPCFAD